MASWAMLQTARHSFDSYTLDSKNESFATLGRAVHQSSALGISVRGLQSPGRLQMCLGKFPCETSLSTGDMGVKKNSINAALPAGSHSRARAYWDFFGKWPGRSERPIEALAALRPSWVHPISKAAFTEEPRWAVTAKPIPRRRLIEALARGVQASARGRRASSPSAWPKAKAMAG